MCITHQTNAHCNKVSLLTVYAYLNLNRLLGRQCFTLYGLTLHFLSVSFNTGILVSQYVQDSKLPQKLSRDEPKQYFHTLIR